jgi:hypothetical protein
MKLYPVNSMKLEFKGSTSALVKGSTEFGYAHQRKLMVEMEEVAKAKVQYEVDENLLQK